MDKKVLDEVLELYRAKPRPRWGKLLATLRVNGVKEIAGRKWHGRTGEVLGLMLELEELQQKQAPKKKAAPKKTKKVEEE